MWRAGVVGGPIQLPGDPPWAVGSPTMSQGPLKHDSLVSSTLESEVFLDPPLPTRLEVGACCCA